MHLASLAICLAALALAPRAQQTKTPEDRAIAEAVNKIFRVRNEVSVRDGAQMLRDVNSQKAIEVLIKVLDDKQPHFRDIAWEVLPDFTDPYARRRIEQELKSNHRNAEMREWCAQLLGLWKDAAFAGSLMNALSDESIGVKRAATRALGQIGHAAAWARVEPLIVKPDIYLRELALEALARIDPVKAEPKYLAGLADADGGVRCALLGALPELYPKLAEQRSLAMLADADWRPRMQAIDNLGAIRTKAALEALITATDDGRPAVAERAHATLRKVTAQRFRMRAQWDAWWKVHADTFDFASAASQPSSALTRNATVSTYHGIEIASDHIAFLIDCSPDMDQELKSKSMPKEQAALAELDTVLTSLQGRLTFNAFAYAEELRAFRSKPVALDKKAQSSALAFIKNLRLKGNKNIWHVLESVVEDPTLDTLFLLSSGEPEVGVYVHWNRVTEHLKELNRFHKVVVHTVAYSNSKWYRDQLEKIAESTGGKFQWLE